MRFGVMNNPLLDLQREIEHVGQSPFDYIELALDPPGAHYYDVLTRVPELGRLLQVQNLPAVCHMPTFVSAGDLSPHIREGSLLEVVGGMEAAAALGARKIVLHPPFFSGMGRYARETSIELMLESLDFLMAKAYEYSLEVCLENLDGRDEELGSNPTSMCRLLERYPDAYMTFDIAHAFVQGGHAAIEGFFALCHERIRHVHISDNWGQTDDHLPLGAGKLDWPTIVALLQKYGYDDTVTLEVFAPDRTYQNVSLERFKTLLDA